MKSLRTIALRYPDTEEGVACAGTPAERATVKGRGKAFLFVGTGDAMIKLGDSLEEARSLASKEPGRYKAGANGWVKVTFGADGSAPLGLIEKWIGESYRLVVTGGRAAATAKKTAKAIGKK